MTTSEQKEQDLVMEVTTKANIIDAIDSKHALMFAYNKDVSANKPRKIYPHNFYWREKKLFLDAYQVSGDSLTGEIQTFKQFDVSLIKDCIILDEPFEVQTGYNGESTRYLNSVCSIIE
jgi:predicted DNA-binding transcriptional regulator YafY